MLNQLTISELPPSSPREVSAREATQSCLDQIARVDGKIHAFISHDAADALAQADAADKLLSKAAAAQTARCSEFRSPSKTFSPSKTSRSTAARKFSANSFRPTTRRRLKN